MSQKNQSIRSFFKPAQTIKVAASSEQQIQLPSPKVQTPSTSSASKSHTKHTASDASGSSAHDGYTSSLSPPASSAAETPPSPPRENAALPPASSNGVSGRIVKSSDDEDSGSDESLPDIFSSLNVPAPVKRATPATPTAPRFKSFQAPLTSPLAIHSKRQKFDLRTLVRDAEIDQKREESSMRVKAMLESRNKENTSPEHDSHSARLDGSLLESVVTNKEEGGMEKVTRALKRTEATNVEQRWHFFNTDERQAQAPKWPFPTAAIPKSWQTELSKPAMRTQTFISGFAEDMVSFDLTLPDELFFWILDEACFETHDILRTSYLNTLTESTEQLHRLLSPDLVDKMLRNLGGTSTATTITEKIMPNSKISSQYPSDWANLRSVILFFTRIAERLQHQTKEHIICMLLRMSADLVVVKNVDLLEVIQEAIRRLSRYLRGEQWESSCQTICKRLFESIELPTLRLQVVEAISSVQSHTHELRRRLAMCFFFDDISCASEHPHTLFDLHKFMERLHQPAFRINEKTDYLQLTALISLLDISVDDGRCAFLDLHNKSVADTFDTDVDDLVHTIKDVMRNIGNPGAAFISRIEAKEALELVSQRIADTIRSRPKPKKTVFDGVSRKQEEDHSREQERMQSFVAKMKKAPTSQNSTA